jgi:prephenate dehydrogenase
MWRDICLANREPLLTALASFREALGHLEAQIAAGDAEGLHRALVRVREARGGMAP